MSAVAVATDIGSEPVEWGERSGGLWPRSRRLLQEIRTANGMILYQYAGGTPTVNEWVPVELHRLALDAVQGRLCNDYRAGDLLLSTAGGIVKYEIKIRNVTDVALINQPDDPIVVPPESALAAREVRDLSGLSAERLGEIFPVERESYQRWVSGSTTPSPANLERLLALKHFLRELANRVADPNSWLLEPLAAGTPSPTPYEALKTGNLADVWDAIADLPSKATRYTRELADGSVLTVTEGSLRGRDVRTSEEELDDYGEWLGEDE